jgi:hypothetical protein
MQPGDAALYKLYGKFGLGWYPNGEWSLGLNDHAEFPWWPSVGRGHWRRTGDGRCHISTRDGEGLNETGFYMQNWHPGPLGFQIMMDPFLFFFAEVAVEALSRIEKEPLQTLDELHKKWPLKRPKQTLPAALYCPAPCGEAGWEVSCGHGHRPTWGVGNNLTEWFVKVSQSPFPEKVHKCIVVS